MSRKTFTNEEQELLRSNQYTYSVTPHTISFTKAFKEIFYEEYLRGKLPSQILEKYGYPPKILGRRRILGISHNIRKQYESPEGLHEGALLKKKNLNEKATTSEEAIKDLQREVEYLRQEMEFLKKISSIRTMKE